jgi:hypothetical protein
VGPLDAELLEKVFMPKFMQEDLVNLGYTQIYLSLMIDGVGSQPFSAVTIPPIEQPTRSYRPEVIESSRTRFGNPREIIEGSILAELSLSDVEEQAARAQQSEEDKKKAARAPQGPNAPRRDDRTPAPRADRERTGAPRPERPALRRDERPQRLEPAASGKTADDLKAILRSTIAASQKDTQKKGSEKVQNLKHTLADVIRNTEPEPPPRPRPSEDRPKQEERPSKPSRPQEQAPRPEQPRQAPPEPRPVFEVPEETLRSLFRDV